MEDAAIVDLYWQRSDLAISETENKYGRYCRTIACNICGDESDAEECVSDTWLRAWNRMPTERPAVLSAFLGCITRSIAINKIRAKHRIKRGGGQAPLAELEAAIGRFVAGLSGTDKQAFVLRYWYLAPVAAIAQRLGCREAKIKSSLFRSRKKLKAYLQEEGLC